MDLSPFDFFRQETSHQDPVVRTEAMNKVCLIIALMGPDKTRNDMLPYLITKVSDLDQVLLALASKLGKFLPFVGGPDQAHSLIPIFEALCEVEEITVRNAAVASISKILKHLGQNNRIAVHSYFEFLKRISSEDAGELFYARVSACHFIADIYSLLTEGDRMSLREIYGRLCKDELSIVRRAAAMAFINVAKHVDAESLGGEVLELLKVLSTDESQTIQVIAIEFLSTFAGLLRKVHNSAALTTELLPLVKAYSDDPSWKIRQALSKKFGLFSTCFTPQEVADDVFPAIIHLVQDNESEVRSIAILEVLPFLSVVGANKFVLELSPIATQLVDDPVPNVRKLLTELCVDVAAKVGPDAVGSTISDLVVKLMDDDDPLVRLRVIRKIPIIAEEAPSLCTRLTEHFKALYSSPNWRVRKELLLSMPAVVKHMGQDYFVEHFLSALLLLLRDGVDEVREACAATIPSIASTGSVPLSWVFEKLFPSVRAMSTADYLVRLSMVTSLKGFLAVDSLSEKYINEVITMLAVSTKDKVPNIRMRAAQALSLVHTLPHLECCKNAMLNALADLQNDKDKDVKYFANQHGKP